MVIHSLWLLVCFTVITLRCYYADAVGTLTLLERFAVITLRCWYAFGVSEYQVHHWWNDGEISPAGAVVIRAI